MRRSVPFTHTLSHKAALISTHIRTHTLLTHKHTHKHTLPHIDTLE